MGTHYLRFFLSASLSLGLCASVLLAQKPQVREYMITFAGMTDPSHRKFVIAAIKDQDPGATISFATAQQQAKILARTILSRTLIEQTCAPWGISVIAFDQHPHVGVVRSVQHSGLPGFPQYVDTGDPATDAADYDARKQAWIAMHPDLYPPGPGQTAPR